MPLTVDMASPLMNSVDNVERQRVLLEDNLNKLTRSLRHWQTWEAEYEGLKEEILALKGEPDSETLIRVGREFGGNLVNEEEIKDLLGIPKGSERKNKEAVLQRSRNQVVELTSRRQDYVQQNIRTLQKQVDGLESQIEALLRTTEPEALESRDDDLPMTDITEHLDDDDNIVSFTTSNAAEVEPKVREVLQKAGIKDIEPGSSSAGFSQDNIDDGLKPRQSGTDTLPFRTRPQNPNLDGNSPNNSDKKLGRKSVSFAEDTKPSPPGNDDQKDLASVRDRATALDIAKDLPLGARLMELDDDDNPIGTTTVVSKTESPEDAALRREMLQYNMEQVGAVVAELDIEEGLSDGSYDDYEDDLNGLEDSDCTSDVDEEDQFGRTTYKVITDDYRREMLELEKKLDARMIELVGPNSDDTLPESSNLKHISGESGVIKGSTESLGDVQPRKKSVSFAEEVDIATSNSVRPSQHNEDDSKSEPRPEVESISGRRSALGRPGAATSQRTEISQLDSGRHSSGQPFARQEPPSGPTGQILASNLVERQNTKRPAAVADPDGFDPILHKREIAKQYYEKRNQLIQQQGGFMPSSEEVDNPLMEEKDGKIKKVSRFRAARLNPAGIQ